MTLATFAVVCAACGGGTAETSSENGPSASAAESGTTSVPKPETATEHPGDDDASDPGDDDASDPGDDDASDPGDDDASDPGDDDASDPGDDDASDPGDDVAAVATVPEPQNAAPIVGVIAASEVAAGGAVTIYLSRFFGDPDGDELVYEAASSDAAVAAVSVSGIKLTIAGAGEGAAAVTVTARDPGGLWAAQSFDVTVRRYVVSLGVADIEPLTAVGETTQLSVSADYSDGSNQAVEAALVQWLSSDLAVAGVSDGVVTAVGAGNATITAAYEQHSVEVAVSVRISVHETATVRVLYAVPSDREFRADYSEGIANAVVGVQSWYRQQLGGVTFSVYGDVPQHCEMSEPADFYARYSWQKIIDGVQHCAPVAHGASSFVWIVYADVVHECAPYEQGYDQLYEQDFYQLYEQDFYQLYEQDFYQLYEQGFHQLGAGGDGLTIMGTWDLDGLVGEDWGEGDPCWHGDPPDEPLGRWLGGVAHELAHAFGLPHPPGCDAGLPTCDFPALMQVGYAVYPDTYLRADDKEALIRSPFIDTRSSSGPRPTAAPAGSRVQGSVSGPGGSPIEGARVSLAGEDFWAWATTGADGTFEIAVPEGSSGSALVSVHAGETAACRWLGYHDGSGGLTALPQHAQPFDIGDSDISGVDIALPASPDEMCRGPRTITGTVLDPDASPVQGLWVELHLTLQWAETGADGSFEIRLPEGTSGPSVVAILFPECDHWGYYGPEGFTTQYDLATQVWIGGVDATGLVITLPASVDELCGHQDAQ